MTSRLGTSEPGLAEPGLAEPGFLGLAPPGGTAVSCGFRTGERLVYYTPQGVAYPLHAPPSRVVTAEEGFGLPTLSYIVDRYPNQHGDTVRDFTLQPRAVQLVILHQFRSRTDYWAGRAGLLDAIRPNRITDFGAPGSLLKYGGGVRRKLDVFIESGPGFTPPQGGWREWSFTEALRFIAHDPTWYDPREQIFTLDSDALPMPYEAQVSYAGSWPAQPTFVVNGPVDDPVIVNSGTGQTIGLNYSLASGRHLTITLQGTKSVLLDDNTNLMPYVTDDSDLTTWSLWPDPQAASGVNTVSLGGSGMSDGVTSCVMRYYTRYLGI